MRVALLTEKYPPDTGGLAISAERLAGALVVAGVEVHVIAPTSALAEGETACLAREQQPVVHRLGAHQRVDDTLAAWFDYLVARHRDQSFDLVQAYFITQAGFIAAYAARYLGLPSIVSARGNDLDRAVLHPGKAAHILYALQQAAAVTANTRELVRKAQALAPGADVTLIPNGVDSGQFARMAPDGALAAAHGLGNLPVLGFVGEARAKKGLAPLLLACQQVSTRQPIALLLVGGVRKGEDKDMLTLFRKQHPALPLVVVPYVPPEALPAYYSLLDILLVPSLHDGLPNALLEGMACECAIIGSDAGGIPDALHDGLNGRLVAPGDVAALAGAIGALLADADLRRRLGAQARATVQQQFPLSRELESNLALYRRLLG